MGVVPSGHPPEIVVTSGPPVALSAAHALRKWPARPRELAVIPFSASSLGLHEDSAVGVICRVLSKTGRRLLEGLRKQWGVGERSPDRSLLSSLKTVLTAAIWETAAFSRSCLWRTPTRRSSSPRLLKVVSALVVGLLKWREAGPRPGQ